MKQPINKQVIKRCGLTIAFIYISQNTAKEGKLFVRGQTKAWGMGKGKLLSSCIYAWYSKVILLFWPHIKSSHRNKSPNNKSKKKYLIFPTGSMFPLFFSLLLAMLCARTAPLHELLMNFKNAIKKTSSLITALIICLPFMPQDTQHAGFYSPYSFKRSEVQTYPLFKGGIIHPTV